MITLGQASNYSTGRAFRHLFGVGTKRDSEELCAALAERYQVLGPDVSLFHSGRSALAAVFKALSPMCRQHLVIVPGLTCIAVVRAVRAAGFTPVFCDIAGSDAKSPLDFDYEMLENLLKSHNHIDKKHEVCYNGIVVVQNTLGQSFDVAKIQTLAYKYHFFIVEDLAHSAGRFYYSGQETGTIGHGVALSFGKGKAIDTITGGAAILRRSMLPPNYPSSLVHPARRPGFSTRVRDRWYPVIAGLCRATWRIGLGRGLMGLFVRMHFVERSADTALSLDIRLTHPQAREALSQLRTFPTAPTSPGAKRLLREYTFVEHRAKCLSELRLAGFDFSEIWYDTPVSPARYSREAKFPVKDCPHTVWAADHIMNLPTWYPEEALAPARVIIQKYEVNHG